MTTGTILVGVLVGLWAFAAALIFSTVIVAHVRRLVDGVDDESFRLLPLRVAIVALAWPLLVVALVVVALGELTLWALRRLSDGMP